MLHWLKHLISQNQVRLVLTKVERAYSALVENNEQPSFMLLVDVCCDPHDA